MRYMPLANTVATTMATAASTSAAVGLRWSSRIWMGMPIHVNWNNSVSATDAGSTDIAKQ